MVGFCFGGGVTWLMATQMPELKAAVPFYGPHPAVEAVPAIQAAVLAIYAGNDQRINQGIPPIEKAMLENGVSRMPSIDGRFPQVSGLCFTYDIAVPVGSRVTGAVRQAADGSCTGAALDLSSATTYKIAENDFMASGGDGYPFFTPRVTTQDIMDQVLADYITANSPVAPAIQGRIVCQTSGSVVCPIVVP
jgi:hypothetical protein